MNTSFDRVKYKIEWLPIRDLSVIWVQAQRPYDAKHAEDIKANFDPDMFGTLAVTLPNGKGIYHIIDGQHRKGAVEMMWGLDEKVPCQVFQAKDPKRAAELFDQINGRRKKPSPLQIFNVRVTAGHANEVAVDKIVRKLGYL